LAAELETTLDESSKLVESSGGVFEVEHNGVLLFSKKAVGRFPQDGEVLEIVRLVDTGHSLEEAQQTAASSAPHTPSFFEWLQGFLKRRTPRAD
jgi:selenoprotein W-related protein